MVYITSFYNRKACIARYYRVYVVTYYSCRVYITSYYNCKAYVMRYYRVYVMRYYKAPGYILNNPAQYFDQMSEFPVFRHPYVEDYY